ncbi:MAG: hypothetical protein M1491_04155 [Deltaproteobacteria bacterium]|nr:hypothetical protein [Deltaproteobacteria bacterium]
MRSKHNNSLKILAQPVREFGKTSTPIGVSEHHLTYTIPAALQNSLPSIKELEKELGYGG